MPKPGDFVGIDAVGAVVVVGTVVEFVKGTVVDIVVCVTMGVPISGLAKLKETLELNVRSMVPSLVLAVTSTTYRPGGRPAVGMEYESSLDEPNVYMP